MCPIGAEEWVARSYVDIADGVGGMVELSDAPVYCTLNKGLLLDTIHSRGVCPGRQSRTNVGSNMSGIAVLCHRGADTEIQYPRPARQHTVCIFTHRTTCASPLGGEWPCVWYWQFYPFTTKSDSLALLTGTYNPGMSVCKMSWQPRTGSVPYSDFKVMLFVLFF